MLKMSLLPFSSLAWSWNSWPRKSSSLSLCLWIMVPIPPSSTMILSRRMASISSCRLFFTPALKEVKSGLSEPGEKRCEKVSKNYWKATKLCWLESLKIPNVEPPPWFSFSWLPSTQPTSAVPSLLSFSSKSLSLLCRRFYLIPPKKSSTGSSKIHPTLYLIILLQLGSRYFPSLCSQGRAILHPLQVSAACLYSSSHFHKKSKHFSMGSLLYSLLNPETETVSSL